jgi:hypothetical protein
LITQIIFGDETSSLNSSLCSLLHSCVASSLLGANILLSTLFSNTLSLCSSRSVRDQVSHPYKTTGKISSAWVGCNNCNNRHGMSNIQFTLSRFLKLFEAHN